ncbi:MAG: hypothetical protein NC115_01890 [Bacteroidales bacterium]|nr:hypothetical protein [Bacteroidales bacterium]
MNWKEELNFLFDTEDWDSAMAMMPDVLVRENYSIDAYLNYTYLLQMVVGYSDKDINERERIGDMIYPIFVEAMERYSENAEYLFWQGLMAYWTEWHFKMDTPDVVDMMMKAHRMEPDNKLYRWAIFVLPENSHDYVSMNLLSHEILEDKELVNIILSKGPVGEHVYGFFQSALSEKK